MWFSSLRVERNQITGNPGEPSIFQPWIGKIKGGVVYPFEDPNPTAQDAYPNLSPFLRAEYLEASPEAVEAAVYEATDGQYTAMDLEAFPIIPLIAALAPLIPTVIQGIQSMTSGPSRPAPAPRPPAARPATPPAASPAAPPPSAPVSSPTAAPGGNNTVVQLLTTLTALLPQVLQAVGSMTAGRAGNESIPIGEKQVPAEAVVHMLKTLAEQALEQSHVSGLREVHENIDYLRDDHGQFLADPADPHGRAQAVYQTMLGELPKEYAVYDPNAYLPYASPYGPFSADGFYEAYDPGMGWGY